MYHEKDRMDLILTGGGLIHDCRADVRLLIQALMDLKNKVNELIDENEKLKKEVREGLLKD